MRIGDQLWNRAELPSLHVVFHAEERRIVRNRKPNKTVRPGRGSAREECNHLGVRSQPPSDKAALREAILNVAEFVQQHPEVQELDLNPMLVYEQGAVAVDARIVLNGN